MAHGCDNTLERDVTRFLKYLRDCEGRDLRSKDVDCEEFLGFLDIEHYLGLEGGDTWSSEGNVSQLMVRTAIGRVLLERAPQQLPSAYKRFAARLTPTDWVLTFNYDTLLERALEEEDVCYRLFPYRFSDIGLTSNTVDDSRNEVVILKLHGSIDWFERSGYDESAAIAANSQFPYQAKHPVFGVDRLVDPLPLVDGPRAEGDPLGRVYRVLDPRPLYQGSIGRCAPFVLAPSSTKLFYARPLHQFWWGLQRAGGLNLSIGIIGYSLPQHDAYSRQAIYHMIGNFFGYEPELTIGKHTKSKLRIVDYRPDKASLAEFQDRYRFVDWNRTELWTSGFDDDAAEWVLR